MLVMMRACIGFEFMNKDKDKMVVMMRAGICLQLMNKDKDEDKDKDGGDDDERAHTVRVHE